MVVPRGAAPRARKPLRGQSGSGPGAVGRGVRPCHSAESEMSGCSWENSRTWPTPGTPRLSGTRPSPRGAAPRARKPWRGQARAPLGCECDRATVRSPKCAVASGKTLGRGPPPTHPGCLGEPQGPGERLRGPESRGWARPGRRWARSASLETGTQFYIWVPDIAAGKLGPSFIVTSLQGHLF